MRTSSGNRWISKKDGLTATLAPISAATSDFSDTTKRKAKVARLLERGDDAALEVANVLLKKHKVCHCSSMLQLRHL